MHCAFSCAVLLIDGRTTLLLCNENSLATSHPLVSLLKPVFTCWTDTVRLVLYTIISGNTMAATPFDSQRAYAPQEDVFFDDGREIELLHFVYSRPNLSEIRGSPQRVLAAIDEYGRTKKYLMNVGEDKGKIVTDLIAQVKPKVMVRYTLPCLIISSD